jgi:hypothetical protein
MNSKSKKIIATSNLLLLLTILFSTSKVKGEDYVVCPGIGVKCMTITTEVPILGEVNIPRFKGKNRGAIELK